ncbi:MAG: hypothetical protein M0R03_15950 [Novosphingobium sp.]|nr:hypothetical protein [Novosphingobium sp.]
MKTIEKFLKKTLNIKNFSFFLDQTNTSEGETYPTINIISKDIESDDILLDIEDKVFIFLRENSLNNYIVNTCFYEDSEECKTNLITL